MQSVVVHIQLRLLLLAFGTQLLPEAERLMVRSSCCLFSNGVHAVPVTTRGFPRFQDWEAEEEEPRAASGAGRTAPTISTRFVLAGMRTRRNRLLTRQQLPIPPVAPSPVPPAQQQQHPNAAVHAHRASKPGPAPAPPAPPDAKSHARPAAAPEPTDLFSILALSLWTSPTPGPTAPTPSADVPASAPSPKPSSTPFGPDRNRRQRSGKATARSSTSRTNPQPQIVDQPIDKSTYTSETIPAMHAPASIIASTWHERCDGNCLITELELLQFLWRYCEPKVSDIIRARVQSLKSKDKRALDINDAPSRPSRGASVASDDPGANLSATVKSAAYRACSPSSASRRKTTSLMEDLERGMCCLSLHQRNGSFQHEDGHDSSNGALHDRLRHRQHRDRRDHKPAAPPLRFRFADGRAEKPGDFAPEKNVIYTDHEVFQELERPSCAAAASSGSTALMSLCPELIAEMECEYVPWASVLLKKDQDFLDDERMRRDRAKVAEAEDEEGDTDSNATHGHDDAALLEEVDGMRAEQDYVGTSGEGSPSACPHSRQASLASSASSTQSGGTTPSSSSSSSEDASWSCLALAGMVFLAGYDRYNSCEEMQAALMCSRQLEISDSRLPPIAAPSLASVGLRAQQTPSESERKFEQQRPPVRLSRCRSAPVEGMSCDTAPSSEKNGTANTVTDVGRTLGKEHHLGAYLDSLDAAQEQRASGSGRRRCWPTASVFAGTNDPGALDNSNCNTSDTDSESTSWTSQIASGLGTALEYVTALLGGESIMTTWSIGAGVQLPAEQVNFPCGEQGDGNGGEQLTDKDLGALLSAIGGRCEAAPSYAASRSQKTMAVGGGKTEACEDESIDSSALQNQKVLSSWARACREQWLIEVGRAMRAIKRFNALDQRAAHSRSHVDERTVPASSRRSASPPSSLPRTPACRRLWNELRYALARINTEAFLEASQLVDAYHCRFPRYDRGFLKCKYVARRVQLSTCSSAPPARSSSWFFNYGDREEAEPVPALVTKHTSENWFYFLPEQIAPTQQDSTARDESAPDPLEQPGSSTTSETTASSDSSRGAEQKPCLSTTGREHVDQGSSWCEWEKTFLSSNRACSSSSSAPKPAYSSRRRDGPTARDAGRASHFPAAPSPHPSFEQLGAHAREAYRVPEDTSCSLPAFQCMSLATSSSGLRKTHTQKSLLHLSTANNHSSADES